MKFKKLLFLVLAIFLFFAKPVFADLGISPSDWTEPNGMPGQQVEKTFYLSRSDTADDLNFTPLISGDIVSWIKIENGNTFKFAKGENQYPVKVSLSIPQNAEKKEYKSEIRLTGTSSSKQTGQIGVVLAALIRIDLTISDKPFLNYTIREIDIPKQEEGSSVDLVLKIANQGNVVAKPTKVTADIFDKYNSTKIDSVTLTDFSSVNGIAPFSEGDMTLKLPIKLTPEQYWANVSVYQDDKMLKTDNLTFAIVKAGTLKKPFSFKNYSLWLIAGGILLVVAIIIVIVLIIIFKKKKYEEK